MEQIPITTPDQLGSDLEVSLCIKRYKPKIKCQRGLFILVKSLTEKEFETFDYKTNNPIPEVSLNDPDLIFTPVILLNEIKDFPKGFKTTGANGGILIWKKEKK